TPCSLSDAGPGSMPPGLLMSRHAIRRDVARFAIALRRLSEGDQSRVPALQQEWQSYCGALHGHHQAEDTGLFPGIREQHPELASVIDQLTADHRRIDPLLESGARAFAELAPASAEAA